MTVIRHDISFCVMLLLLLEYPFQPSSERLSTACLGLGLVNFTS